MNTRDLPSCLCANHTYSAGPIEGEDSYHQRFECQACKRPWVYITEGIGSILITVRATAPHPLKIPTDLVNGYLIQVLMPFWQYHRHLWKTASDERTRLVWLTACREAGFPDFTEVADLHPHQQQTFEAAIKAAGEMYPPPPIPPLYPPQLPADLIAYVPIPSPWRSIEVAWQSVAWDVSAEIPVPILRGDLT